MEFDGVTMHPTVHGEIYALRVGDRFRTEELPGIVRAYEVLNLAPLSFGQAHGSSFKPVTEVVGEFKEHGLGTGFPAILGQINSSGGSASPVLTDL